MNGGNSGRRQRDEAWAAICDRPSSRRRWQPWPPARGSSSRAARISIPRASAGRSTTTCSTSRRCRTCGGSATRATLAHPGARDLERSHRNAAAAAVRRAEAGGARGRRRADPERRHGLRQSLQRLAGGRRYAQPAGARRQRSSSPRRRHPRRCRWPRSSPATARTGAAPTSWSPRSWCRGRGTQARSTFLKLGARKYLVISIVMVAVVDGDRRGGTIAAARVAVGACSAVAQRLPALEAALVGRRLDANLTDLCAPSTSRRSRRSTTCAARPPIAATRR